MTSYNVLYQTTSPSGAPLTLCFSVDATSGRHALEQFWEWRGSGNKVTQILSVEPAVTVANHEAETAQPESREARALKTLRGMHNADGHRMVGFPRATEPQDYCTGCGMPAPCPTMMVLNDVEETEPEVKPHDRWTDIDWAEGRVMSYSVESCHCTTPWRHQP